MLQHAGHFHHALQLDFAPAAADGRTAQGGHQLAGFGAKLLLGIEQSAHLFVQRGVSAGARLLQFLDLAIDLFERGAHRRHHVGDGLLAQVEIAAGGLLGLRQRRLGHVEKGLIIARQRVGGERPEGRLGFLLAPAQNQPCQGEAGDKTEDRQNVLHQSIWWHTSRGAIASCRGPDSPP